MDSDTRIIGDENAELNDQTPVDPAVADEEPQEEPSEETQVVQSEADETKIASADKSGIQKDSDPEGANNEKKNSIIPPRPIAPKAPNGKKKLLLWGGIGLVAVLVAGVICYFCFSDSARQKDVAGAEAVEDNAGTYYDNTIEEFSEILHSRLDAGDEEAYAVDSVVCVDSVAVIDDELPDEAVVAM